MVAAPASEGTRASNRILCSKRLCNVSAKKLQNKEVAIDAPCLNQETEHATWPKVAIQI